MSRGESCGDRVVELEDDGVFVSTVGNTTTITVFGSTTLLLQSVVERGARTSDGDLLTAVAPAWAKIVSLLENDPTVAYKITPRKWEEIIAGAYAEAGFDEVTLTPHSADGGRDVIAVKRGCWSVRILDQVKAYGPGHLVPADDVRALLGVLHSDRNATKGLVTTTSDFAPKIAEDESIAPFVPHRLELVNGTELMTRLTSIAHGYRV
jgi:restriction system protein